MKLIGIIPLLLFSLVTTSNAEINKFGEGSVSMTGQIQESACSIHTDDVWQEIPFGVVSHRDIMETNTKTSRFLKIRLVNCIQKKENEKDKLGIVMMFEGERDTNSPDLFAVQGAARGVGLKILDYQGLQAKPGEELPASDFYDGENEMVYRLHLIKNGVQAKEGDWSSAVRFIVAYR
ncbi:TPA: fimbrial protein [Serratia fonticola]